MKKIISVLLCVIMLLSALPMASFSAEENPYIFMDVNWGYEVIINDEEPVLYYAYTVEKSGVYSFYSFCSDDDPYMHCYDENHNELGFDDNSGFGHNFAYNKYLSEGKTYYFEIGAEILKGDNAKFGIEIRDLTSGVTQMEIHKEYKVKPDVDYDREFFAFTPETDGYYAFMCTGGGLMDLNAVMYDSDFNYISEDDHSGHSSHFYLPYYLKAGETYYYTSLSDYYMMKDIYEVRVQEATPILDINVVKTPDKMTYYNGFVEDSIDFSGLELELIDSNGKVYQYSYDDDTYVPHTSVYLEMKQSDDFKYYISIDAGLAHKELSVTVTDCPVQSISVHSASDVTLYENTTGYYSRAVGGADMFYYVFDLPSDLMMQINYKDGTSVVTSYFEPYDGMKFKKVGDQYHAPMTLGENAVRLSYYDVECDFIVNVVESPVDYFTVERVPYYQGIYTVNLNDPILGDCYEFYPQLDGIEFTAHYTDGTTEKLTYFDVDPYFSFTRTNNSYKIEKHRVTSAGKTKVSFTYCNKEITFDAVVLGVGDCDSDGAVTVMDATKIQMYLAQSAQFTNAEKQVADVDNDGKVTVMDATSVQLTLAQLE